MLIFILRNNLKRLCLFWGGRKESQQLWKSWTGDPHPNFINMTVGLKRSARFEPVRLENGWEWRRIYVPKLTDLSRLYVWSIFWSGLHLTTVIVFVKMFSCNFIVYLVRKKKYLKRRWTQLRMNRSLLRWEMNPITRLIYVKPPEGGQKLKCESQETHRESLQEAKCWKRTKWSDYVGLRINWRRLTWWVVKQD